MGNILPLALVVATAVSLTSSCGAPEPNPSNIRIGMTREKIIKKFGVPDQQNPREEVPPKKMPDIEISNGHVIPGGEMGGWVNPETFHYFSRDGTLITTVVFSEYGRVTSVRRRKL